MLVALIFLCSLGLIFVASRAVAGALMLFGILLLAVGAWPALGVVIGIPAALIGWAAIQGVRDGLRMRRMAK